MTSAGWRFYQGNALGLIGDYAGALKTLKSFLASLPNPTVLEQIRLRDQDKMNERTDAPAGAKFEINIPEKFKNFSYHELKSDLDYKTAAMLSIAHFQFRTGKKAESVKTLKSIEAVPGIDAETLSYVGYLFALNGAELDRAGKYVKGALAEKTDTPILLRNAAVYAAARRNYKFAEATFKKAIGMNISAELVHFEYGKMLLKLGRRKEAAEQFKLELKYTPDLKMAQDALRSMGLRP